MGSRLPNVVLSDAQASGRAYRHGIYRLFARVLDYPSAESPAELREVLLQLRDSDSEVAELLGKLAERSQYMTLGQLQEHYASTFDMRPDRTLNLGCHIFGEDVRRNLLMTELKKRMEARQISMGCELPDHLSLVLELLAREESDEEARTLMADLLSPAVSRLLATFAGGTDANPYESALQALEIALRKDLATLAAPIPS